MQNVNTTSTTATNNIIEKAVIRVATHDGLFHADETLAVAIFMMAAKRKTIELIRTRNPEELNSADVVIDVGGEYAPAAGRFDHHQRGFSERRANGVPFAAAGLVWRHFGDLALQLEWWDLETTMVAAVFDRVDAMLIQGVDALDVSYVERAGLTLPRDEAGGAPVKVIGFSEAISLLNPPAGSPVEAVEAAFENAVYMAKLVLDGAISSARAAVEAEAKVSAAIARTAGEAVLELEEGLPWQETLLAPDSGGEQIKLVVFPAGANDWRVQVVPCELGKFQSRLDLPAEWAGLKGADLHSLTGVEGVVFCHPGRFIAGARTREGAMALARLALK